MSKKKLTRFYEQFTGDDQVLIPIIADPDALASAMAVKRLLWRKTAGITIAHINTVKRPDNLAMIRLLGVKSVPVKEIDPTKFTKTVLVDAQPNHNDAFSKFEPDVIIDHHPDSCDEVEYEVEYKDIRPKYGATASILLEYLKTAKIKPSTRLATALYYAIRTDTDNFNRKAVYEDVRAFQYLFPLANIQIVRKIEAAEMRPGFLRFFKTAIDNRKKRKGWMFSHLGAVPSPDILVIIADFFLRIDDVNWSIVSGTNGNKLIVIFRSFGYRRNAGKVAEKAFGELGSAGGHKSAARAEISLSVVKENVNCEAENKLANWIISQIQKKK
ncbi:MAG: DHH family phosphoesterase [Proteobacteria bacterium]|nr:DHH family phosphoesterase [Pseudomonadota bacterium]